MSKLILTQWPIAGVLKRRPGGGGGPGPGPDPVPIYTAPAVPSGVTVVQYTDIVQAGDTLNQGLNRLTSPAIVQFPAGLFEIVDFNSFGYGVLANNCLGIIGAGVDKTVFQIRPGSSTHVADVPIQSSNTTNQLSLMRLAANAALYLRDFTLSGTDQPNDPNTGLPHLYNGLILYRSINTQVYNIKITGVPGNWNSPPGETFMLNCYKDTNTVLTYVETDGWTWVYSNSFNADGTLQRTRGSHYGGSSIGCNNSTNIKEYGNNLHDSWVSSRTYSFSGTSSSIDNVTSGVETHYMKVTNNANWSLASGKRFSGVNHENVYGTVVHDHVDITLKDVSLWDTAHMTFNSKLGDNPNITIIEPTWHETYARYGGMFTFKTNPTTYAGAPQTQVTPPTVILDGSPANVIQVTGNPSQVMTNNPRRNVVWIRN